MPHRRTQKTPPFSGSFVTANVRQTVLRIKAGADMLVFYASLLRPEFEDAIDVSGILLAGFIPPTTKWLNLNNPGFQPGV